MKRHLTNILLILVLLLGLSLLVYPTFSDYWNSFRQSRAITSYKEQVADIDDEEYDRILQEAHEYNQRIPKENVSFALSDEQLKIYEQTLNVGGTGIMGYIEIPKINVFLPIYHGTSETVLQVAIGHVDWTYLPVGGEGTHSVLSGHRGLPSAKLFTDLDEMVEGDTFVLKILDDTLTYEVDQILVVLPDELDELQAESGKDYCTLLTCTPYGINTHRLLVRGHRIDNVEVKEEVRVTGDAIVVEQMVVALILAMPMLLVAFVLLVSAYKKPRNRN